MALPLIIRSSFRMPGPASTAEFQIRDNLSARGGVMAKLRCPKQLEAHADQIGSLSGVAQLGRAYDHLPINKNARLYSYTRDDIRGVPSDPSTRVRVAVRGRADIRHEAVRFLRRPLGAMIVEPAAAHTADLAWSTEQRPPTSHC
jgi:hypothetical protein